MVTTGAAAGLEVATPAAALAEGNPEGPGIAASAFDVISREVAEIRIPAVDMATCRRPG
ncbi:hypothetical protein GCM10027161_64630 [Microbispora hainanensis]